MFLMYQKHPKTFQIEIRNRNIGLRQQGSCFCKLKWLQEGLLHRVSKNPAERLDGNVLDVFSKGCE